MHWLKPFTIFCAVLFVASLSGRLTAQAEAFPFDEIKHRLQIGADQNRLLQEIRDNGIEPIEPAQLQELERLGAKEPLLAALRGFLRDSGNDIVAEVIRRSEKTSKHDLLCWILRSGRSLRLSRAQMRQMQQAKLDLDLQRALAGSYRFPGFAEYADALGMFTLQHPAGWHAHESFTGNGFAVILSPEANAARAQDCRTGLRIRVQSTSSDVRARHHSVLDHHRRGLPAFLATHRQAGPTALGAAKEDKLAGQPAAEQEFRLRRQGEDARALLAMVVAEDLQFTLEFVAPAKGLDEVRPNLLAMLASFRPLPYSGEPLRRKNALQPADVVQQHRNAVVKVIAHGMGTGSGFIARADGLVLTNAHVIRDDKRLGAPVIASKISVELLTDAGKQTLAAELLDWVDENRPHIDMALLRLPRSSKAYPTIPMSTVQAGRVKIGDGVIALGFPGLGKGEMFMTQGSLTAVKHDSWTVRDRTHQRLDRITIDATIAPGNSGGPCIDLRTGGVIGLNTVIFGQSLYSYSGVCAIDHALARFPQLRWYPRDRHPTAEQHLELGAMLRNAGNLRSARNELRAAQQRASELTIEQQAEAAWQLSQVAQAEGDYQDGTQHLDACLRLDPRHAEAALHKALTLRFKLPAGLELIDAIEKAHPNDWRVHETRARLLQTAKRYQDALRELDTAATKALDLEPKILILRGEILALAGQKDDAMAAYEKARVIDPTDPSAAVAIANARAAQNDAGAAAIEFNRVVKQFPDSAAVLSARSSFYLKSKTPDDRARAIDDALAAVFLEWAQGNSGGEYLERAANLCSRDAKLAKIGLQLAQLLHSGKGLRNWASHRILGQSWGTMGNRNLQGLHHGSGLFLIPRLVNLDMVTTMIEAGYSADLVQDSISRHALSFAIDKSAITRLEKVNGFTIQHLRPLLGRAMKDQLISSSALSQGVAVAFKSKVTVGPLRGTALLELKNTTSVPLSEFSVRRKYLDANKKQLFTSIEQLTGVGVLEPGASTQVAFEFDTWKVLTDKKIRDQIKSYSVEVSLARNATFMRSIRLIGRIDKGVYKLQVVNASPFHLRQATLRCHYRTSKLPSRNILNAALRPFTLTARIPNLSLAPGKTSAVYDIAWPVTVEVMRSKGAVVPKGESVTLTPHVETVSIDDR